MIKAIRKALSKNRTLYARVAKAYHLILECSMGTYCSVRNVRFFFPRKPGGKYKSQYGQDFVLEKLGLLKRGGFFVEVGSNDPVFGSNSYFLEKEYNFHGVSIDAIDFKEKFSKDRPGTEFFNCVIDEKETSVKFNLVANEEGWEDQMSSIYSDSLENGKWFSAEMVVLPAKKLSDICLGRGKIDVLLIDVEGHEFNVLNSLDWAYSQPQAVVVENSGFFYPRKDMEKYMSNKGYKLLARIGTADDVYVPSAI